MECLTDYVLGDLFEFSNGLNADRDSFGSGIPFANTMEVIQNQAITSEIMPGKIKVSSETLNRYALRFGDVLFNRTSETPNEAGLTSVYLDHAPAVFGGFIFRARPRNNLLDPAYAKYALRSFETRRQIVSLGQGGIRSNISQRDLKKVRISLPPIQAQRATAKNLDDVDSLISRLERLIAKKAAIKQGMMQQLLTGKARLPGFNHDWRLCRVGDFAQVTSGGTPSTSVSRYWGGDIRWMSSGELHFKRVSEVTGRITEDGFRESSAQMVPAGTVLIGLAGQGKTRGTAAISRVELTTNQSIAGILPSGEHSSEFLYYNLDTRYDELRGMSTGDGGRGGLNLTIIRSVPILMPDMAEQEAIAGVFSDADDELDALNKRLVKARSVKQGMMQELLSGRTRLQPAEAMS